MTIIATAMNSRCLHYRYNEVAAVLPGVQNAIAKQPRSLKAFACDGSKNV